jgi:hypothetical protein
MVDDGSHTAHSGVNLNRYLGLLGKHAGVSVQNPDMLLNVSVSMATRIRANLRACTSSYGDSFGLSRSGHLFGADTRAHWMTYIPYHAHLHNSLWLQGWARSIFTAADMLKLSRAAADAYFDDGSSRADFNAEVAKCGLAIGTGGARQTDTQQRYNGGAAFLTWEDDTDDKLSAIADAVQAATPGGATPVVAILAQARFNKLALTAVGDL